MELVITGWRTGIKIVSVLETLRRYKNIGLKQAKEEVDGLLAGEAITLSGLDGETLLRARGELEALGCVCQ